MFSSGFVSFIFVQEPTPFESYPADEKPSPGITTAISIEGAEIRMAENQNYDPKLLDGTYKYALSLNEKEDWDSVVEWLSVVVGKDEKYEDAADLLHEAKEKLKQTEYEAGRQALHEKRWDEALDHFQKVADLDDNYRDVASYLEHAKKGLELPARYASLQELLDQEKRDWDTIIAGLQEIVRIDKDFRNASSQLRRARLRKKVAWLRDKLREVTFKKLADAIIYIGDFIQGIQAVIFIVFLITVGIVSVIIFIRPYVGPSPPTIDKIEILMNGDPLNLDQQLPSLTSGEAVVLEVIVFDTNEKEYPSDELVCRWAVAPLGDEDEGINTNVCKTFYTPSQEYSKQVVVVEVEVLKQQFEPSDPISVEFDIVK